mgnify:CR=1 FL=1
MSRYAEQSTRYRLLLEALCLHCVSCCNIRTPWQFGKSDDVRWCPAAVNTVVIFSRVFATPFRAELLPHISNGTYCVSGVVPHCQKQVVLLSRYEVNFRIDETGEYAIQDSDHRFGFVD